MAINTASRPPRISTDPEQVEIIDKNLALIEEFWHEQDHLDEAPNGCTLLLLPDDDPAQTAANIRLGLSAIEGGENVYFRHVHRKDQE